MLNIGVDTGNAVVNQNNAVPAHRVGVRTTIINKPLVNLERERGLKGDLGPGRQICDSEVGEQGTQEHQFGRE